MTDPFASLRAEHMPVWHSNDCLTRKGGPCNCHPTEFDPYTELLNLTPRQQAAFRYLLMERK